MSTEPANVRKRMCDVSDVQIFDTRGQRPELFPRVSQEPSADSVRSVHSLHNQASYDCREIECHPWRSLLFEKGIHFFDLETLVSLVKDRLFKYGFKYAIGIKIRFARGKRTPKIMTHKHGGRRPGAGRPELSKLLKRKNTTVKILPSANQGWEELAKTAGISKGGIVEWVVSDTPDAYACRELLIEKARKYLKGDKPNDD